MIDFTRIPANAKDAVIEELQRMRRRGVQSVSLSDSTWKALQEAGTPSTQGRGATPPPSAPKPATPRDEDTRRADPPAAMPNSPTPTSAAKPTPAKSAAATPGIAPIPEPTPFTLPEGDKPKQWNWLRDRVLQCPVCREHVRLDAGKQVVFGVGNLDAKIFFCGEAPGADEEVQGEPFVGKAGQLLTKIIQAMGLRREDVYIGNIMNWRPEMPNRASGNRPPTPEEMRFCLPYLHAQVEIVKPQVIVALGNTAVTGLLGPDPQRRMGTIRGTWMEFAGIPMLPTYHPSYLLRYASMKTKRQVWEDMLHVMEKVGLPISEKQRGYFQE